MRPPILALALATAPVVKAAATVLSGLLVERPSWLFATRVMMLSKPTGGTRAIEMAEPIANLIESIVMARSGRGPPVDCATMAILTIARIRQGQALVVADVKKGFHSLPHSHMIAWASAKAETRLWTSAQLSHRAVVDELGQRWTRDCGGPTGARTTCAAFCALVADVLPTGAGSYVDDIVAPFALWEATQMAIASLGLEFADDKVFYFNVPGFPPAPEEVHILGVPLSGVSKRIKRLEQAGQQFDIHDTMTLSCGGLYSMASYDLQTGNRETRLAFERVVLRAAERAGMAVEDLPISPRSASDACMVAALLRMLVNNEGWDFFESPTGWFSDARAAFERLGYSSTPERLVIT